MTAEIINQHTQSKDRSTAIDRNADDIEVIPTVRRSSLSGFAIRAFTDGEMQEAHDINLLDEFMSQ